MEKENKTSIQNKAPRILSIDIMRGVAMCIIIIYHAQILLKGPLPPYLSFLSQSVGSIGTPMFSYISGVMLGYFLHQRHRRSYICKRYVRRGIFLIAVIHLLNAISVYPHYMDYYSFKEALIYRWFITDTIGFIIILAPLLARLLPSYRLILGILMLIVWKLIYLSLSVNKSNTLLLIKELFVGINTIHILEYVYPILPVLGIFLIGSFIGDRFALAISKNELQYFVRKMARTIFPMLLLCMVFLGVWYTFKISFLGLKNEYLRSLFYPDRFYSTLPFYMSIFFGIFPFIVQRVEVQKKIGKIALWAAVFGRTSLFTFVAQYFVIQGLPSLLGLKGTMSYIEMTVFVVISLLILNRIASFYHEQLRGVGNYFIERIMPSVKPNFK